MLGVVLNHTQTIKISVNQKTKELDIYETDHEEILYLNRGIRFYTEQSISLSEFFEDIISISVVVINPAGNVGEREPERGRVGDLRPGRQVEDEVESLAIEDIK